jgi:uncharacterized membrane protein
MNTKIKWLMVSVVLLSLLTIIFYFLNFHNGFSSNPSDWGDFGSYVGGVIGVVFSCVNMFILIITLREQIKSHNEERIRNEKEKERMRKEIIIMQINEYISIYKNSITEEMFTRDFVEMNNRLNNEDSIKDIINDFILSDTHKRYHILDNLIICLDNLRIIDHDYFQFFLNKITLESKEIIEKYLILAINSLLYENNKLFKKYLFWYISIKPEILIRNHTQSLRKLLYDSCPDGNYYYIEWV